MEQHLANDLKSAMVLMPFLDANYTCCTFHTCWVESGNGTTYSSYLSRREVNLEPRNVDINSIGQYEQKNEDLFSQDHSILIDWKKNSAVSISNMESTTIEMPPADSTPHEGASTDHDRYPYQGASYRESWKWRCARFHFLEGYKSLWQYCVIGGLGLLVAYIKLTKTCEC